MSEKEILIYNQDIRTFSISYRDELIGGQTPSSENPAGNGRFDKIPRRAQCRTWAPVTPYSRPIALNDMPLFRSWIARNWQITGTFPVPGRSRASLIQSLRVAETQFSATSSRQFS